jgi:hypothetical protein
MLQLIEEIIQSQQRQAQHQQGVMLILIGQILDNLLSCGTDY